MFDFAIDVASKAVKKLSFSGNAPAQELATQEQSKQVPEVQSRLNSVRRNTASILVLGRSGSGKTFFVETACSDIEPVAGRTPSSRTTEASLSRIFISDRRFKLIDTPGFDNITTSDIHVYAQLADYLLDRMKAQDGITGVVYIHRAGDPLESRALAQNMKVLSEVFLGEAGLSRLTIIVVPASSATLDPDSIFQDMSQPGSALRAVCAAKGVKIRISTLEKPNIDKILLPYASQIPIQLHIQSRFLQNPKIDFIASIEDRLGYREIHPVRTQLDKHPKQSQNPYENEIATLKESLLDAQSRASHYSSAYKQTDQQLKGVEDEMAALRRQHQQTQSEYGSLRSQLQLQENVEQSDIVQSLKDLNRGIDDIGRSISEYLVDTYGQSIFGKSPDDITALDAKHLPDLKVLLCHAEGKSSLISSSSEIGMRVEDFFDYSIRCLLCLYLCQKVFGPFHPGIDVSQSDLIKAMYYDVQQREPQAVAAKWRVNSFKSIYKPNSPDMTSQQIDTIARNFISIGLGPLIAYFFGQKADVVIEEQHFDHVRHLVQAAWDWNSKLKGEVVMLGDFSPTVYPPSHRFDPTAMDEFEPNPHQSPAKSILGTLGLGLVSLRAVGGSKPPEMTVVYKALVATKSLYS
ncbi:hypothetical protein BDV93DRAFT_529526 [Ceratobasidium sp. AG-I]|nr:hypothetical protein BDV93DRAFT_529526 [Ceratobasidium sp. AG-I]